MTTTLLSARTASASEDGRTVPLRHEPVSMPVVAGRRRRGPRTPEQLVDRYGIASPQREVFIEYLKTRSPALTQGSLHNLATKLLSVFWLDITRHHPDLTTFKITKEMAAAWRERLVTADGHRRADYHAVLFCVRAFYLDISQWALEDSYWAEWVVPSPIRHAEAQGYQKARQRQIAAKQQRTRELAPHLPALVQQAEHDLHRGRQMLADARLVGAGGTIMVDGREWDVRQHTPASPLRLRRDGLNLRPDREEDRAFWAWAVVEVLRHSGIRVEELLQLTHMAIQRYRLPATGELIPLVHLPPSKSDTERLLVASPELMHALAQIVSRVRGGAEAVPLSQRWDSRDQILSPALPHLFAHSFTGGFQVINVATIRGLLNRLADRADLRVAGQRVRFTPHDFRRLFATEALANGLPPHIVQTLMGHKSLSTTQAYAAIYPQDVIRHHRIFIERRRSTRPSEEHREPTAEEWAQFEAHFLQRKVSLGTCGRAYGTECHHEHACLRCALLRPDPDQADRLRHIITNLRDRVAEAEQHNWLGEVEGLKITVAAAEAKLAQMERAPAINLGLPRHAPPSPDRT